MKQNNKIRDSLNENLSGLIVSQRQHAAVMDRIAGGKKVNRRLTASLVLTMVVMLFAGAALAWGLTYSRDASAMRAARNAVMGKYDMGHKAMDMFWREIASSDHDTTVRFTLHDVTGDIIPQAGIYTATIAQNGSTEVLWTHDGVDPTSWSDGSLDDAVWGEKQILAYRAKRDQENLSTSQSIVTSDAPTNEAVDETGATPPPAQGKLTQEQAIAIAKTAMKETFGFIDETFVLFDANADSGERDAGAWSVRYRPTEMVERLLVTTEGNPLGEYTVTISDETGKAEQVKWSLQDRDKKLYTERTWGQANAYNAKMLPWVLKLVNACALLIQKGEYAGVNLIVEDQAAYDQAFRDAGFDAAIHNHVLPQAGDISYEKAVEIVAQALLQDFGVSREVFDASGFAYADLTQEKDHRKWCFTLQNNEEQCSWTVELNAETGEILSVVADPFADSNG